MKIMCTECGEWLEVEKMSVRVRPRGYLGYFFADLYKCPRCGKKVICGFGDGEVIEDQVCIEFDFEE